MKLLGDGVIDILLFLDKDSTNIFPLQLDHICQQQQQYSNMHWRGYGQAYIYSLSKKIPLICSLFNFMSSTKTTKTYTTKYSF